MSMSIQTMDNSEKMGPPPAYGQLSPPQHGPLVGYGLSEKQIIADQEKIVVDTEIVKADIKYAQEPIEWMPRPEIKLACPPGLEYLAQLEQIQVQQHVDKYDELKDWNEPTRYRLLNGDGQQVFYATEDSEECERKWRKGNRSFIMRFTDSNGSEVLTAKRKYKFVENSCWLAGMKSFAHLTTLETPEGQVIGYVQQKRSSCNPKYAILDADMNEILIVEGPDFCEIRKKQDVEFSITQDSTQVGKIVKAYKGKFESCLTHGADYGIAVPANMDVVTKATVISGIFLIDAMYFEEERHKQCREKVCREKFDRWCEKHCNGKKSCQSKSQKKC